MTRSYAEFVLDLSNGSGYLDTNIVIHSLANDPLTTECRHFLELLERGVLTAVLDVTVLHELSYSIPRYRKEFSKADLVKVLNWLVWLPGVECDRQTYSETIQRWGSTNGLGFVDAFLTTVTLRDNRVIYSKNVRELAAQGATVPNPLPQPADTSK